MNDDVRTLSDVLVKARDIFLGDENVDLLEALALAVELGSAPGEEVAYQVAHTHAWQMGDAVDRATAWDYVEGMSYTLSHEDQEAVLGETMARVKPEEEEVLEAFVEAWKEAIRFGVASESFCMVHDSFPMNAEEIRIVEEECDGDIDCICPSGIRLW